MTMSLHPISNPPAGHHRHSTRTPHMPKNRRPESRADVRKTFDATIARCTAAGLTPEEWLPEPEGKVWTRQEMLAAISLGEHEMVELGHPPTTTDTTEGMTPLERYESMPANAERQAFWDANRRQILSEAEARR